MKTPLRPGQAAKVGIAFAAVDNGFAACDDGLVQAICDSLTEDKNRCAGRK